MIYWEIFKFFNPIYWTFFSTTSPERVREKVRESFIWISNSARNLLVKSDSRLQCSSILNPLFSKISKFSKFDLPSIRSLFARIWSYGCIYIMNLKFELRKVHCFGVFTVIDVELWSRIGKMPFYVAREAPKVVHSPSLLLILSFFVCSFCFLVFLSGKFLIDFCCLKCQAMEENLRRDIDWGFASCQELEVPSRWNYFSGQFYSFRLILNLSYCD